MDREVIVVGAGPSGSAAAAALAQKGRDVLLIDRGAFPRDKTCGDGIPASAIEELYELGMKEKILQADFYPIKELLLSSPNGHVLQAPIREGKRGGTSYVIPRMKFDVMVQEHAVESGAEFLQAQVSKALIEDGRVTGVKIKKNGSVQEISSKVVVGADGVTSAIARSIRPDKAQDKHRAVALRTYIEDIEEYPNVVEFYLYKEILPGYAWIFPMGEGRANLGLGMRLDKFRDDKKSLEELLDIFLQLPAIKNRLRQGGVMRDTAVWQLNFGSQDMKRGYDGAVLIGDAAGLINPSTGGGISNGLQSAFIAVDVIEKSLKNGDTSAQAFKEYELRLDERLRSGMRRSYFIQRSLMFFPRWVDFLVRWGGSNSSVAKTFIEKL